MPDRRARHQLFLKCGSMQLGALGFRGACGEFGDYGVTPGQSAFQFPRVPPHKGRNIWMEGLMKHGEKLILMMLADMYKKLNIQNAEFGPDFIKTTITSDHLWGFDWKYGGIPFEEKTTPRDVTETVDYLDMWYILEQSYNSLSPEDQERVKTERNFGRDIKFPGFDGNHEPHFGIARYLIEQLHRFEHFKDHYLNSHSHQIDNYQRMYRVFEPLRQHLHNRSLSADEIIEIFNAG
jgi:uncharacterized protein